MTLWQTNNVPSEWRNGIIIPLPKKGDLTDCINWRVITLLSVPGKVFSSVLLGRIKNAIDSQLYAKSRLDSGKGDLVTTRYLSYDK